MTVTRMLALAAALSAALAGPVFAGDSSDAEGLEVILRERDDKVEFGVRGKTTPFPNGTRLEVQLVARGRTKDIVCALFRVETQNNEYTGGKVWTKQALAPLTYEAQVTLDLGKQAPSVRRVLMTEYGFADGHKELVGTAQVAVGTVEEQAAFAKANLTRLLEFVRDLEELRKETLVEVRVPAAENPDWQDTMSRLNAKVLDFRRTFDGYVRGYVVLLERGFVDQLLSGLKVIGGGIYGHHKGREGATESLTELEGHLAMIAQQIRDRLPTEEGPLVHPDAVKDTDEEPKK